jgi:hypothetical protein
MNDQISWSLSDEVAPYFEQPHIKDYCHLIDELASKGRKYQDLKKRLLEWLEEAVDLYNYDDEYNIYRRAYEFAKYY